MFGQNPVAPKRDTLQSLLVHSVFYTIQGEGPLMGNPAVFVRLAGCNLKCAFCDTDFTSKQTEMSAEEVTGAILEQNSDPSLIVITGGEPMLQNLPLLLQHFAENLPTLCNVQIETAGTVWPEGFREFIDDTHHFDVVLVVSPKTPKVHPMISRYANSWKYIVNTTMGIDMETGLPEGCCPPPEVEDTIDGYEVFLQPMDEQDDEKNGENTDLAAELVMQHDYRISLQMHKILGLE